MNIFLLLAVLALGALCGFLFRKNQALASLNQHFVRISLWALLAMMGAKLAQNRALFVKDISIFFFAIFSAAALAAGFAIVFWVAGPRRKAWISDFPDHSQADVSSEKSGGRFHELLSVAGNGGCILAGFIAYWPLPQTFSEKLPLDICVEWLLRGLLFFIGFGLGRELLRIDIKRLPPKLLLVPFINIALSLAFGYLFGLFSRMGGRHGALLTAGMGWYSLSSVLLTDRGMIVLSLLAFIHNVFRELLAILFAPLAAKLSPLLPIHLGGATSMDVMLPFVQKYCGKEYTLLSFYSGIVCSVAVMPLVNFLAG